MYGSLIHAFVEAIRAFPGREIYGLNVVQVNDSDGQAVINTALPCVAVSLSNSRKPTTFIGGGIYEQLRVTVQVIVDFTNHSSSPDSGEAVKFQNLPYHIRRYVENEVNDPNSCFFHDLREFNGFSAVYEDMKTYTSVAFEKKLSKEVLVYSFVWSVNSLDRKSAGNGTKGSVDFAGIQEVILEDMTMTVEGISEWESIKDGTIVPEEYRTT